MASRAGKKEAMRCNKSLGRLSRSRNDEEEEEEDEEKEGVKAEMPIATKEVFVAFGDVVNNDYYYVVVVVVVALAFQN